jgi:putative phosphoribosyl transferase
MDWVRSAAAAREGTVTTKKFSVYARFFAAAGSQLMRPLVAPRRRGDVVKGTPVAPEIDTMDTVASVRPRRLANRRAAGALLAEQLRRFSGRDDVVVLALPRGGVPVGYEVARALGAALDVFVVRKLGFPGQPELAMGAIASGDVRVLNDDVLALYPVSREAIEAVTRAERLELARREQAYRAGRSLVALEGRVVVLVDDGLATGSTMRAAVLAVRRLHPARVVVAVPVGAQETCEAIQRVADDVVCLMMPEPFRAVGLWYYDFSETTDEEVCRLLAAHRGDDGVRVRS